MALDPVVKIQVTSHASRREAVLSALESTGRVHLVDTHPEVAGLDLSRAVIDTSDLAESITSLDRVIDFLREYAPRQGFISGLVRIPPSFSDDELERMAADRETIWKAGRAWRVAVVMTEREGDARELEAEMEFLKLWSGLDMPLESLGASRTFSLFAGTVSSEAVPSLLEYAGPGSPCSIRVVDGGDDLSRILVACHREALEETRQKLAEAGFSIQDFGARRGTVQSLLAAAEIRLRALRNRHDRLEEEARRLSLDLPKYEALRDAAGLLHERLAAARSGLETGKAFVLRAWVRERDVECVGSALARVKEVFLERIEPDPGELPPAALTESPLIDPYVMLTDMYGRPSPGDPDPTPQIALFFAAFYGICIGDAGYGILIALASGIAIAMNRRKGRRNRLLATIFQGGIAAIIAGTFFGGWFGMDQSLLPSFLLAPASLLNSLVPDGGPFALSKQFLYATIALGLVQLLAGILLNFQKRWRAGERLTAVVEQTGWVLALLGLFPWLFNHFLLNGILYDPAGPVDRVLLWMLMAGAVIIFIMGGRSAPGFGKVGLGAMAAYGIVNLLADALSYSRLFALSLSGGIIASVVNQIAGMLPGTDIPVIGLFISIPIIVFGHLFNILMSLLGGFIHTARLQFVEYFGKYYEGTGSPFVPLSYNPQFINIIRRKA